MRAPLFLPCHRAKNRRNHGTYRLNARSAESTGGSLREPLPQGFGGPPHRTPSAGASLSGSSVKRVPLPLEFDAMTGAGSRASLTLDFLQAAHMGQVQQVAVGRFYSTAPG